MLEPGDQAPDFEFEQDGQTRRLSDLQGHSAAVVYFYPKDNTPVCTRQACHFRDAADEFRGLNAQVIGISADDGDSHSRFASQHDLNFPLVSDRGGRLAKAYGVNKTLGLLPGRVTFVIDKQGVVQRSYASQFSAQKHVSEAVETLKGF